MIRDKKLEKQVYEPQHIGRVLAAIEASFPFYFESFARQPIQPVFEKAIQAHAKDQGAYEDYLDFEGLEEYELDPKAFKTETKKHCPIIRHCLMSQDEVMDDYKRAFVAASGRQLLDPVRRIAEFGAAYAAAFDDQAHEAATSYTDLGLGALNEEGYGCVGVIGYGVQSSLLHGLYPREFAMRSQDAVWSLYFLSDRQDFALRDGSEFMMVHPDKGTCEQNYFYPADLFGFYSLQLYLMLKEACARRSITLSNAYRYIYLSAFDNHVAATHRHDISTFKMSSDYVERQPWF